MNSFADCSALSEINLDCVEWCIGERAFNNCVALHRVTFSDHLKELSKQAFKNSGLVEIVVPASVTKIGDSVFSNCEMLEKAVICEGVENLSNHLFADCKQLKEIHLPQSVDFSECGIAPFYGCTARTIYAPIGSFAEKYAKKNKTPFVAE